MPATIDPVNAIILLGRLEQAPASGYEIKQSIEGELEGLIEISAGTIYYTLKKLEAQGWIRGTVSKQGRRPARRLYQITPAGRKEFRRLLEETALRSDRFYSPFDVVLYFTPALPAASLHAAVEKRLHDLTRYLERLRQIEEKNPGRWPFHLYYLHEKAKEVAACNERWCRRLKKKIQEKTMQEVGAQK